VNPFMLRFLLRKKVQPNRPWLGVRCGTAHPCTRHRRFPAAKVLPLRLNDFWLDTYEIR
jgi:hypothetical protein